MAVEQMRMMNVMAPLGEIDNILLDILKSKTCKFVSSQSELDKNNFVFSLEDERNLERNIELNYITTFKTNLKNQENVKRAKEIMQFLQIDEVDEEFLEKVDLSIDFDSIYTILKEKLDRSNDIHEKLKAIESIEENYKLFKNVNLDLSEISNMEYFTVRFGILDKDGRLRLKRSYDTMIAMIFHTATIENNEIYLAIYPNDMGQEMDRVLKSLNWRDIDLSIKTKGTATDILLNLKKEETNIKKELFDIEAYKNYLYKEKRDELMTTLASMLVYEKIEQVKKFLSRSKKYFYLSAWVGVTDVERLKNLLFSYDGVSIAFLEPEKDVNPPTKLKNNSLLKPFEALVNMYGTPNYNEIDPTPFFAITYMILFGAMFGDLGQGAVFLLGGIILSKTNKTFGGLLKRMGISSMIFGLLYGSVFGKEDLIEGFWFKPFDSINKTLVIAIYFGIGLLFVSYVLGIINRLLRNEKFEAIFDKEGLLGVVIFFSMINIGISVMGGKSLISMRLGLDLILLALVLMILKRIIVAIITKEKPKESASDYYIEGAFGLIEALLSTMSGIISFIRVGAFAINHVGLFLAFQTLSEMIGKFPGNLLVLILGNVVIICLEGLIVFIQSLRLEYYEMFSKYYKGDGYEFRPDYVNLKES
ncbi:V-type ATPase 116kDa subunit family protein [uncultured Peptoniphilus sp.]|uniref:V-type ATP synthase subunit I n=1 Tax=uncultured Peptoniphilus sp. TaxID=254354 RepID=UPI002803861F|nr:V-type ATPase 116kDa subunit family protein [uncultured Peptoniphilus sp.]